MRELFKFRGLKNREEGRRVFILGNGPSVALENLSKLRGELVIGMNASTQLEEIHGFTQSYYCISDSRFLNHPEKRHWGTSALSDSTIRVIRKDIRMHDDASLQSRTFYVPHLKRDGFSENVEVGFYYGCTTTMLALQLAYHLGCKEIYMLGVDLRYNPESPRFYKEKSPQLEDAFTSVQIWNIANAANLMANKKVYLYGCSEKSFLRPYVPYVKFSDLK
jgi:hypothetical protein